MNGIGEDEQTEEQRDGITGSSRQIGAIRSGARDSLPIVLAYVAVGATFGVIAHAAHLSPWMTLLISGAVYAGAAQFLLVGLVLEGSAPLAMLFTMMLANSRHLVYSSTLRDRFRPYPRLARYLMGFGLTDEVFAFTASRTSGAPVPPVRRQLALEAVSYAAWLLGTVVGAWGGRALPPAWSASLGYALPALFLALLAGQTGTRSKFAAAITGGAVAVALDLWGLGRFDIVLGAVAGAVCGSLLASGDVFGRGPNGRGRNRQDGDVRAARAAETGEGLP